MSELCVTTVSIYPGTCMYTSNISVGVCMYYVTFHKQDNSTALHKASKNGHHEVVRVLLAAKATVNTQDKVRLSTIITIRFGHECMCS